MTQYRPVVAHFTTGLTPAAGGPFESVAGLVRGIEADRRFAAIVAAPVTLPEKAIDGCHWGFCPVLTGSIRGNPWDAGFADGLTRAVIAQAPAIVHVHGLWDAGTCAAMRVLHRRAVPLVYSPRGMLEPWALRQRWFKKQVFLTAYLGPILRNADLLHATSLQECDALRRLGFRQPIAVVPNGIAVAAGSATRSTAGVSSIRKLLYMGRLHPKKGLENLLLAWARVRPPGWQLFIAGMDDGGYLTKLERLSTNLGLNGSVEFKGPQIGNAKWDFLASGDAFVHPSFSENFGIVVGEAMAASLPVIATVGTPWKLLADHGLGWWVEPTPDAIAGALEELAGKEPPVLREMGRRARAYVMNHFEWNAIGREMADCYGWLLGRNPAPKCLRLT